MSSPKINANVKYGFGFSGGAGNATFSILCFFLLFPVLCAVFSQESSEDMPHQEVEHWAEVIGKHTFILLNTVAKYKEMKDNFDTQGTISDNDGLALVKQMAEDVTNMMRYKVQAVKRIMNVAEEVSQDPSYLQDEWKGYYNAKLINQHPDDIGNLKKRYAERMADYYGSKFEEMYGRLELTPNSHFDGHPISLNYSTVHVPTNVFDGGPAVTKAIRWSEALEKTFYSNYQHDPSLSWQFFGSSTGFLRQFPGAAWQKDAEDPDLYDARLRSWYIQAANTPKDMVILLDVSGSMTGLRKEIAKHVVLNILETLNDNDFVNIYVFNDKIVELDCCVNDTLVQANLENIGKFKLALENLTTENIANFSLALTTAFKLLQKHKTNGHGSQCNQAIMLVTDGAPYTYDNIFHEFNWPQLLIRLFTYLIGREVTEIRPLAWMACANKGFFVHVTTESEVREQVLKYIPVVARPMVMSQDRHPIVWTGVYADITGRRDRVGSKSGYRLLTTVSVPVFNRTQLVKRVSDLLGVAGTDVPIREIEKLVPPYKLGVNGYSFMVNKNGYILYHPDFRPTFENILKPNYNSVDLAEVELVDVSEEPRYNNTELNTLRRDMIEQTISEADFKVRVHLDNMKRVEVRNQRYFTYKISETPFSLGISIPQGYGKYKVKGQIELSLAVKDNVNFNASDYLNYGNWSLHPEWVYCEYKYDQGVERSPEELLLHFLVKAQMPGWKWRSTRTRPPPDSTLSKGHQSHYDETDYYCDKNLVQSLLFDAKATDVYNSTKQVFSDDKHGKHKNFGITSAFVSTRSGLTRWVDVGDDLKPTDEQPHFMKIHDKAIDEVWYKRAVDYYKEEPEAYVYSVPFDAATRDPSEVLVTASRAIFVKKNRFQEAPAAVVGVNIKLDKFVEYFKNETYNCREYTMRPSSCSNGLTCKSETLDCYLLDDNGFVIASEKAEETGIFFGEIQGTIMESLVESDVYHKVKVYDYQAVCLDQVTEGSFASVLLTPFQLIKWTAKWVVGNIMWILVKTQLYHLWDPNEAWAYSNYGTEDGSNYPEYGSQPPINPLEGGTVVTDEEPKKEGLKIKREGFDVVYNYVSATKPTLRRDDVLFEDAPAELEESKRPVQAHNTAADDALDYNVIDESVLIMYNYTSTGNSSNNIYKNFSEILNTTVYNSENNNHEQEWDNEEDTDDNYDFNKEATYEEPEEPGDFPRLELAYITKTRMRPCDKETNVFKLNTSKLREIKSKRFKPVKGKLSNCHPNGCGRPFSVQKVIQSNMVLVVIHIKCPCVATPVKIEPTEVNYTTTDCERRLIKHFRQRPSECLHYHPDEAGLEPSLETCGGGQQMYHVDGAALLGSLTLVALVAAHHVGHDPLIRT